MNQRRGNVKKPTARYFNLKFKAKAGRMARFKTQLIAQSLRPRTCTNKSEQPSLVECLV